MRRSLSVALFLLLGAGLLLLALWGFDPPVSARIIQGTIVSSSELHYQPTYYRTTLVVKTDDGRLVLASSERRVLPHEGERAIMQERVGLFGSRKYVEVPSDVH
jgi:hypothetical protein